MEGVKIGITVCPFKTVTLYKKKAVTGNQSNGTLIKQEVSCSAKDAHIVEHGFGECDQSRCPYWNSDNATCNKTQK